MVTILIILYWISIGLHSAREMLSNQILSYDDDGNPIYWAVALAALFWPVTFVLLIVKSIRIKCDKSQRLNAIKNAIYYGFLPWQCYEKVKHYKCSYLRHLVLNIGYALKWMFFLESDADREFENRVNNNH